MRPSHASNRGKSQCAGLEFVFVQLHLLTSAGARQPDRGRADPFLFDGPVHSSSTHQSMLCYSIPSIYRYGYGNIVLEVKHHCRQKRPNLIQPSMVNIWDVHAARASTPTTNDTRLEVQQTGAKSPSTLKLSAQL